MDEFWDKQKIYEVLKQSEGLKKVILHDGPPYTNGDLHLGHALNKILKDIICDIIFKNLMLIYSVGIVTAFY